MKPSSFIKQSNLFGKHEEAILFIFSKEADETKRNFSVYKTNANTLSIVNEQVKKKVRGKGAELRIQ